MRRICFVLMMLIAATGMAAGLGQLLDGLKKPPVVPQPTPRPPLPPQPPKSPTGK